MRRAYVDVAGIQLHYRYVGDPHKPALLLLHQSPSSSAMYEPLMALLQDRFFLLAPDTPGFGNSDPLPGGVDISVGSYASYIKRFLQAIDIDRCQLFGHHTGAAIAVQLEHDFPGTVSAMALSGPTLLNEEQKLKLPLMAAPFPLVESGAHLISMWERMRAKDPSVPLAISQRELMSAFGAGDAYQASYTAVVAQDFASQLPSLACPVLVYAGDNDPLYQAVAPTLALLHNGSSHILPGGERTYICERQAELVADILARFFLPGGEENNGS